MCAFCGGAVDGWLKRQTCTPALSKSCTPMPLSLCPSFRLESLIAFLHLFHPPGTRWTSSFKTQFKWHHLHDSSSVALGWIDSDPLYSWYLCLPIELLLHVSISLIVSQGLRIFLFLFLLYNVISVWVNKSISQN